MYIMKKWEIGYSTSINREYVEDINKISMHVLTQANVDYSVGTLDRG